MNAFGTGHPTLQGIAKFIASKIALANPVMAFYPQFIMSEAPPCPYCDQAELRRGAFVLENDLCLLSIKPSETGALEGAGIIVPKAHRATVFDLTTDEWLATQSLLLEVKAYLDASVAPDGYNLGWNIGEAGGQHVMHAHFHVMPRFADEPMCGRGIRSHLKSAENRRRSLPKIEHGST